MNKQPEDGGANIIKAVSLGYTLSKLAIESSF